MLYRLRQFLNGFHAAVDPAELAQVAELLPPKAFDLFQQMPVDAQRHSLNVLQTLQKAGHTDADLLSAALLHDVGKVAADEAGVPIRLWSRGLLVVVEMMAPHLLAQWAVAEPTSTWQNRWRYTLHVHLMHPQIGAAWAKEAGCSPRTVWLIDHHQDKDLSKNAFDEGIYRREISITDNQRTDGHDTLNDPVLFDDCTLLKALQWADGQN